MNRQLIFRLPKGLLVREADAHGADWFEPHRFRLIVTSDDPALVSYLPADASKSPNPGDRSAEEFYSGDVAARRKWVPQRK